MIQKAIILNKYFNDKLSLGSNCRIISIDLTEVIGKQKDGGNKSKYKWALVVVVQGSACLPSTPTI